MKYVIIYLILSLSLISSGQVNFMAYHISGRVTYSQNNNRHDLKIGKILSDDHEVKVENNSNLILICENTYSMVHLKPGTHKLKDHSGRCGTSDYAFTRNYLSYVWWQLTTPDISPETEHKKMMSVGGGVYRGCPGIEFAPLLDTINLVNESVALSWKLVEPGMSAEFVLYEFENSLQPFYQKQLSEEYFNLDSIRSVLNSSAEYYWNIRLNKEEKCPRKVLRVWDPSEFRNFEDSLKKNQIPGSDQNETLYLMGFLLESNLFPGEALRYYQKASAGDPENIRYANTVNRFINIVHPGKNK